jgi:hypothetical protein
MKKKLFSKLSPLFFLILIWLLLLLFIYYLIKIKQVYLTLPNYNIIEFSSLFKIQLQHLKMISYKAQAQLWCLEVEPNLCSSSMDKQSKILH